MERLTMTLYLQIYLKCFWNVFFLNFFKLNYLRAWFAWRLTVSHLSDSHGITLAEQVVCKFVWSDILLNVFIEAATIYGLEKLDMHEIHVCNWLWGVMTQKSKSLNSWQQKFCTTYLPCSDLLEEFYEWH